MAFEGRKRWKGRKLFKRGTPRAEGKGRQTGLSLFAKRRKRGGIFHFSAQWKALVKKGK